MPYPVGRRVRQRCKSKMQWQWEAKERSVRRAVERQWKVGEKYSEEAVGRLRQRCKSETQSRYYESRGTYYRKWTVVICPTRQPVDLGGVPRSAPCVPVVCYLPAMSCCSVCLLPAGHSTSAPAQHSAPLLLPSARSLSHAPAEAGKWTVAICPTTGRQAGPERQSTRRHAGRGQRVQWPGCVFAHRGGR